MSKTISELKRLQNHRQNGPTPALPNGSAISQSTQKSQNPVRDIHNTQLNTQYSIHNTKLIIIYLFLAFNFATTIGLFALFYTSRTERQTTLTQLNSTIQAMERSNAALLSSFTKKFDQMNIEIEKASKRTEEMGIAVKELNKEQEAQRFAIETLTKAKNTLFKRINTIESN
ncbi:MAG: hypothetical protein C4540_00085 [Candidatus Omnitrophota bacterium]|nr:MAG: hypothetical protein C4540_00085 [Candidatus Omnitrophota bacterium]